MKIAIISENFGMGGIQRVSKVIGQSLQKRYEVFFYSIFDNENYYHIQENFVNGAFMPFINFFLKATGKIVKVYKNSVLKKEYNNITLKKMYLKKLVKFITDKGIDIVIVTGPALISCITFLKEHTTSRYVAWIHNNYDVYMNNYTLGYNSEFLRGLKSANSAVCLTKGDYLRYSRINTHTHLIYNPLTIQPKSKSRLDSKKICFVGRLDFAHKGIDYLIEIAKSLPADWVIEFAGKGSRTQLRKFKRQIKEFDLEDKILFKGALVGDDLKKHYLETSLYLMTSRWEGMPLVLVEAMSFGLPIIAFSQSGSLEVLDNGKYGILVENGNVSEMLNQLKKLMSSESLRKNYQRLSLKRVNDFDLESITSKWLDLLESM